MNFDHIIVRYSELSTKGKNKQHFISLLRTNIKNHLSNYRGKYILKNDPGRIMIKPDKDIYQEVYNKLLNVFGISSISPGLLVDKNFDTLNEKIVEIIGDFKNKSYKLNIKRIDKNFQPISSEMVVNLAKSIYEKYPMINVDVKNPDISLNVEVRFSNIAIYINKNMALGGLPVNSSGHALSLLSGGIDSPVASFLCYKRGLNLSYIHFTTPPHTSLESLEKVFDLSKNLFKYSDGRALKLYVVNFTLLQNELMHLSKPEYRITIMRRMFVRIANIVAEKIDAKCLATGEALGQVASQTIESITTIENSSTLPILRPLICYDKEDIIKISKSIDTYTTSIKPFDDCCSLFVPKNPVIKPKIREAEFQENNIMWKEIIDKIIENNVEKYVISKEGVYKTDFDTKN
ncbi:tRNA 4-thiouridine(8) synthase ThiI [Spiroplasma endosymbiont of Anurida maritima]|uniref:tRNA uracil 4-sulfurtransferase ThiI n=1 Tax=Spiroplasma endosymbiont of Anurida maritima TaxID=2967972 RepID=UPI0036D2BF27